FGRWHPAPMRKSKRWAAAVVNGWKPASHPTCTCSGCWQFIVKWACGSRFPKRCHRPQYRDTRGELIVRIMVLGVRGIPNVQGGIETHASELYQRVSKLGCQVEVLVRSPFVSRQQRAFGAIRIRRLWSPRAKGLEALIHSILGVLYAGISRPDVL